MRILLVEDDALLADGMVTAFKREGYAVDHAENGKIALSLALDFAPDLIVLDLGLPDIDGMDLLSAMRTKKVLAPVLILTARDALEDKIKGLDRGADDYLTKPFELAELFARIRALERRQGQATSSEIQLGKVKLDVASRVASVDDIEINLSRREFSLLRVFMERPGQLFSRAQLEEKLYSWGEEVVSNTIDVHIHNLRKKVGVDFIKNVRGVGYKVNLP